MIKCTTVGVEPSDMCYEICVMARRCEALKAWKEKKAEQIEPQTCETCKYDVSEDDYDLYDMCEPMVKGECRYEPKTERHLPDYSYEADLGRRIMEQMKRSK